MSFAVVMALGSLASPSLYHQTKQVNIIGYVQRLERDNTQESMLSTAVIPVQLSYQKDLGYQPLDSWKDLLKFPVPYLFMSIQKHNQLYLEFTRI